MKTTKLSFPSVTPLLAWAEAPMIRRLEDVVYVAKEDLFHYFVWYPEPKEYRLVMVSSKDIGGE